MNTPVRRTTARRMFMAGPATAITKRCQRGCDMNSSGAPLRDSSGFSPRHFHVSAQRQCADAIVRSTTAEARKALAEPDGKYINAYTKPFSSSVMAELVHQDHDAEHHYH